MTDTPDAPPPYGTGQDRIMVPAGVLASLVHQLIVDDGPSAGTRSISVDRSMQGGTVVDQWEGDDGEWYVALAGDRFRDPLMVAREAFARLDELIEPDGLDAEYDQGTADWRDPNRMRTQADRL